MDRSHYPALATSQLTHLDASAVFPLHANVIHEVHEAMTRNLGAPGKAQYKKALEATREVDRIRQTVANFLRADSSEIFFVASATDAARLIAEQWTAQVSVLYAPEDHSRVTREITKHCREAYTLTYKENGEYDYESIARHQPDVAILSHMHHIYGSDNDVQLIRKMTPNTKLVIDASQSISRTTVDVQAMGCDALFFSAQKLGGLAGVGVLFIAKKYLTDLHPSHFETNTLPLIPLVSLRAAIETIDRESLPAISSHLAALTIDLIDRLQSLPAVQFTKGPAYPDYRCHGHGIISFSVQGYSSQDVAIILAEQGVQVRGGDHCVDPAKANQDVVRISMHRYTTALELDKLVAILAIL